MSKLEKVKILRLKKRVGLIRARLEGVRVSTAPTLTFLDSHVECAVGWLEPLLFEIWKNRTTVVCPIIDTIHASSFQIIPTGTNIRGSFDWHMTFRWKGVPQYEVRRRKSNMESIRSPTMAGGLFSIDKSFFRRLGFYDPGLEIWGAENLELSFKTWMCGGTLLIMPCSRVAHIFRKSQPYKFPKGNMRTFMKNNIRVAEVWLDKYKKAFYALNPELKSWSFGNVEDRLKLKKDLKCHSFGWYLKNVVPEIRVPEMNPMASGTIKNARYLNCIDTQNNKGIIILYPCHGSGNSQILRLTKNGLIEAIDLCIGKRTRGISITTVDCEAKHAIRWRHLRNGYLEDTSSRKCLTAGRNNRLYMEPCTNVPQKKWIFSNYANDFPF
ncbi:DgyrCDS9084 [Dimorphilus gyrociliatus]|nr:DgyrCDS9084 [Dimorphilus gyrociliatus]